MKLTRRDFLKGSAAFAVTAGALGMLNGIAFAEDEKTGEKVVNVAAQSRDELAAKFEAGKTGSLQYCAYDPTKYLKNLPEKMPLVVFLHGEDGKGDNGQQILANDGATFFMTDYQLEKNPTYVIAPQCPGDNWTDEETVKLVKQMIDEYAASHKIDTDRIYLEGMSMGGTGVWNLLFEYPNFFAAALPMCGVIPQKWYDDVKSFEALKNQAIWAFHCMDDDVIPEAETAKAVQTLKDNGSAAIRYEAFQVGSMPEPHKVWERVYSIGTPYNWLFIQSQARTKHGELSPHMLFSHKQLKYGITEVRDYAVGKLYVMDQGKEALIIDTAMGGTGAADLYAYIRDNVLTDKDAELDILLTHKHGDHILGIPSLVASGKVRKVYIHPADEQGLVETMEKMGVTREQLKLASVVEGDVVKIGNEELEVVEFPGHTEGSVVFFYKDYIFTGDAIGSGDLYLFKNEFDTFRPHIDHFMAEVLLRNADKEYELLTGHFENLHPFTLEYVRHMLILVRDVINGKIETGIYTRRPGRYATYLDANVYFTGKKLTTDAE